MVQFDNRFDAVMHAEALLAGVNMKDSEIAEVTSVLQRETLEQMHIILADPEARAVLRLKLLVKGAATPQKGRHFAALPQKGKKGACPWCDSSIIASLSTKKQL